MASCSAVAEVPPLPAPGPSTQLGKPQKVRAEYIDTLPAMQPDGGTAMNYAVEILNSHRRSAGISNQVTVPSIAAILPPPELKTQVQHSGILLSWPPVAASASPFCPGQCRIRVERRLGTARFVSLALLPVTATSFEDRGFEWERTYDYAIRPVISIEVAGKISEVPGDESPVATVFADDVFPPPQPSGLQAVYSGAGQKPFIDLVWTASIASDLAGYNVYRREENGAPAKINGDLVKAPAFRDGQVEPGKRYLYSVSAVDLRGNESPRSGEANETVPAP